jgi:hypothetical protein
MNVIPLDKVDRQTVQDMAEAAADNGHGPGANPFPEGHAMHDVWLKEFHTRDRQLLETYS